MVQTVRLLCFMALAGCATSDATPLSVAPYPKEYPCQTQRKAAEELRHLGPHSALGQMMGDYKIERDALRRLHRLPVPDGC